ncbi:MAG: polysaccharide deacetylase family protein [bacterium]
MANKKRSSKRSSSGPSWVFLLLAIIILAVVAARILQPPKYKSISNHKGHSQKLQSNQYSNGSANRSENSTKPSEDIKPSLQNPDQLEDTTSHDNPIPTGTKAHPIEHALSGSANGQVIAVTFDAGADAAPVSSILDTLNQNGLRCTFFLTGAFCDKFPDAARQIGQAGHEIGNHTYSHPHLTQMTTEQVEEQIQHGASAIERGTGRKVAMLFRPPYGDRNSSVDALISQLGYKEIMWSLDSWDSVVKGITADQISERVLSKVKPGSIILLHCGSAATAQALPQILSELHTRGYRIVTVSELVR